MTAGGLVILRYCRRNGSALAELQGENVAQRIETAELLTDWRAGDTSSRDALIARLLPELEQIAASRLRSERHSSLSTNDLVNEAVLRIVKIEPLMQNRAHLLALISKLMRNVLIDNARARNANKRDHDKVELQTRLEGVGSVDLHELDSALIRLGVIDAGLADIVEMRFFGGMTVSEVAEVTGLSEPTVKRRWQSARAWIADAMANPLPQS
ncbi:sigma-70 family RNA polymerase sigma factor [Pacificimonas sp. WHA3]|uniref:Sigma-70 family RNA polymerase sigma factor n=1 Tax=Pacificimonas pallii TaxID=2827236 RepID=A0ABS6SDH3_9SPHN|nr:sigma-70 family RNA polymerase sigma factor [Pacificimonas pallii]